MIPIQDPSRMLPAGPVFAELDPAANRYSAYIHFGGLILTVKAPCGCEIHYDTSEFSFKNRRSRMMECCQDDDCTLDWDEAEKAALVLLSEAATIDNIYHDLEGDMGGEG